MIRKLRMLVGAGIVVGGLAVASYAIAGALDKPLKAPRVPNAKTFSARLVSYQETPLTLSTHAFGDFNAKLVNDATLHFVLRFANLEGGNTLFAHVHLGAPATTGGVMFFLCGTMGGRPACPNGSGEAEGDVTAANVIGPSGQGITAGEFDEVIKAMRSGAAYANVHTVTYAGGEIRGQIHPGHGKGKGHDK